MATGTSAEGMMVVPEDVSALAWEEAALIAPWRGQIVEAVSEHAIEAAIQAAEQSVTADNEVRQVLCRELEEARYEASRSRSSALAFSSPAARPGAVGVCAAPSPTPAHYTTWC